MAEEQLITRDAAGQNSCSLQSLAEEAERLCQQTADPGEIHEVMAEVVADTDNLSESQRQQLNELGRLMATSPTAADDLKHLRRDGKFHLHPSDDRMSLLLDVMPPLAGGRPVEVADVVRWLRDHDIRHGVNLHDLEHGVAAACKAEEVCDVVAVSGQPPQPGRDASLEFYARRSIGRPLERIDARDLRRNNDMPWICEAGDCVVRHIPATAGEAGYDALGHTLKPPTPATLPLAVGRYIRTDGDNYYPEVSGVLLYEQGHIEVRRVLILNKDLDRHKSPLEFDGEVIINAGVLSGVTLRATGNITIQGLVEAAQIESTGGDVKLGHGVAGRHDGEIRAARDVVARFVENAAVYAGRDIIIEVGAMHSRLVANRAIHMITGRGQLIGGRAMAGELVEVRQLGARSDVVTEVTVGLDDLLMNAIGKIDKQIDRTRRHRDDCAKLADRMKRLVGDPARLDEASLQAYLRLRQVQLVSDPQINKLEQQRAEVLDESVKNQHARVDVTQQVMPKAVIRIGSAKWENDRIHHRCRIVYDEKTGTLVARELH